ncbi:7SK snRNA methylphosphate capping enzyme-like isoform X2 [Artemia franciscana]|uniref:7SK snRNA methylphosphate capping enzyme-like isoform X2 n=1 Tax=Artemia franciscana TaxID=6661 RepID=UPI0032DABD2D
MASASIDSSPSYFGASPKSFGASPKRRQKASASIDSSPSYFGASPKSSVTNHCKFPSSAKEPSQSSYSKIAEDTKIKFHIPDQQVKGRSVKHFHGRRKRCVSTSEVYAVKRKKSDGYVLPTKFLLGGNVFDPLNLQGLEDGRLSAQVTPDSSPFATPAHHREVEVYIPANVHDPLNLNPLLEQEEEVTAPPGRLRSQSDGAATLPASTVAFSDSKKKVSPNSVKLLPSDDQKEGEKEFHRAGAARDEIVSPVVPQSNVINVSTNIRQKKKVFLYGNYNRYYGYRNPNQEQDPRLKVLKAEDFENKTVLDIGCNIGHITWCIARDFRPRQVTGIDIDQELIGIARKNAKYYAKDFNFKKIENLYGRTRRKEKIETDKVFPYNITFASSNYVLVSDDLLSLESPQYDTILCLSVTKWVHLNWGDEGVERLFKRAFKQLKPGGKLYLEPQDWRSYKSKKKLDPKITSNFESIRLRPYVFLLYMFKTYKHMFICFSFLFSLR